MVTSERKGSLGTAAPCGAREVDDDDDNDEVAAELRRLPDFTVLDRSLGGFGSDMQITLLCSVGERKRAAAAGGVRVGAPVLIELVDLGLTPLAFLEFPVHAQHVFRLGGGEAFRVLDPTLARGLSQPFSADDGTSLPLLCFHKLVPARLLRKELVLVLIIKILIILLLIKN